MQFSLLPCNGLEWLASLTLSSASDRRIFLQWVVSTSDRVPTLMGCWGGSYHRLCPDLQRRHLSCHGREWLVSLFVSPPARASFLRWTRVACVIGFVFTCYGTLSCNESEWLISWTSSSPAKNGFLPAMDWSASYHCLRLHLLWSSPCYLAMVWSGLHH